MVDVVPRSTCPSTARGQSKGPENPPAFSCSLTRSGTSASKQVHVVGMAGAWEGPLLLLPLTSHQGLQHMGPGRCYPNTHQDSGGYSTWGPAEMVVIWGTSI